MRRSTIQIYCAGLWKNTLPLDLLWYRERNETLLQPSVVLDVPARRAPSWAWASVNGQIMYYEHLYLPSRVRKKIFCEVLQAECTAAGQSVTGEVTAGFIRLACSILQVSYHHGELSLKNQGIQFCSDNRTDLEEGIFYIVRMARFTRRKEETFLVVKAIDASEMRFVRVGLAWSKTPGGGRWPEEMKNLVWPEITII